MRSRRSPFGETPYTYDAGVTYDVPTSLSPSRVEAFTSCPMLFRFVSIEKVGASVAAAITNLNPFIATGLAILLLGERVTLPILLGTLVIVLGTVCCR